MVCNPEIHIVCVKFIVTLSLASLWSCAVFCRCFHKDSVLRGVLVPPPEVVSFQILSKKERFSLLLSPPSLPSSLLPSSLPFLSSSWKVLDYYFLIYKNISIAFLETLSFPLKLPIRIIYLPPLPQVPPWTDEESLQRPCLQWTIPLAGHRSGLVVCRSRLRDHGVQRLSLDCLLLLRMGVVTLGKRSEEEEGKHVP